MDFVFSMLHVESWGEFSWVAFGLLGQLLFTGRFLVQWIASERARRSYIPIAFWYFSIGGGVVLLAYALYRRDPVFVLGQATGIFIYARNLYLIHAERHEDEPAASEAEDGGPRVKNEV